MKKELIAFYLDNFKDWYKPLESFLLNDKMNYIREKIVYERKKYKIFPKGSDIFKPFSLTPYNKLKVVIIADHPYYKEDIATGVPFSSSINYLVTPSLEIILDELERDVFKGFYFNKPYMTNLDHWCEQGVLMLNKALTCPRHRPNEHQDLWSPFIKILIKEVLSYKTGLIYVLWGKEAFKLEPFINTKHNYLLKAEITKEGFLNCSHFSKINKIIESNYGKEYKINWEIKWKN